MTDLTNPRLIWAKGWLFLLLGILASGLLASRHFDLTIIALHLIAIWAFCRFYYFAFYVIQHYVDPSLRFSGLIDFLRYALGRR